MATAKQITGRYGRGMCYSYRTGRVGRFIEGWSIYIFQSWKVAMEPGIIYNGLRLSSSQRL